MNQFAPKSAFLTASPIQFADEVAVSYLIPSKLRRLAAQFKMHHAFIHRLGPRDLKLADATYSSTLRNIDQTEWTLGNLLNETVLNRLSEGNCIVEWQSNIINRVLKTDALTRLNIHFGVSVPFHNALGNHVALTLCDSVYTSVNLAQLTEMALPLIDAVLSAERKRNTAATSLSTRETDCLQWAAAGKTSLETGIILGLSPHTVNQYLTAATTKLQAVNRTHAVTKAVRLGLVNLSAV